ncbi:hypothetical protein AB8P51_11030 [Muriicola sp. SD30]|uniref:hypothetical protein n=1 Tax=Muriicola sp. SD30 TaxID=3240936 RepID=UPI00350F9F86
MKKIGLIAKTVFLTVFVFAACEKSEEPFVDLIEGTYVGTLTDNVGLKGGSTSKIIEEAFAEITKIRKGIIEVHLYNVKLDTTFMLDYYEDMDSINVCLTGDEFENMYGHMLGRGHMSGGMMNDMRNDETEWVHHLNDEHQEGDEHFGGFDMQNHTFRYRFNLLDGGISKEFQFEGQKE